jgi:hypothetical protein
MIKICFFLLILCPGLLSRGDFCKSFIDPTGTYILKGIVEKNIIKGHYGELRVKLVSENQAAISFYMNGGYPDYVSGSFMDTLVYEEDHLQFKPSRTTDCVIFFYFSQQSAELRQTYSDPRSGCGFAKGVIISSFFEKYSTEKPIIQDLSPHGIVP